jgi:hypothetical protein
VGGYAGRGAREDLVSLQGRADVLGLGQDPVPAVERTVEDPIGRRLAMDGERVEVQRGSMDVIEIPHQPGRDVIGDAQVLGCHRCLLGENVMSLRTSPHHGAEIDTLIIDTLADSTCTPQLDRGPIELLNQITGDKLTGTTA